MGFITNEATVLERSHAITILLLLYAEGSMIKGILAGKITKNSDSIKKRIEELEGVGLIKVTPSEKHPFPHVVELTHRGCDVAKHLAAIEGILKGDE